MPEFCTCGAQLPPDARFCHKCGKPQYEEPLPEVEVEEAPPRVIIAPVVEPPPLPISFRNTTAVRVAFLAAGIASLLITVPMPAAIALLWILGWLVGSGFLSVWFYNRRAQTSISLREGVRLGWITGLFSFVIATLFFTISVLSITTRGGLAAFYREQFAARGPIDAPTEEMLKMLQNPSTLATVVLLSLFGVFVVFTALASIGGALGSKVLDRQ